MDRIRLKRYLPWLIASALFMEHLDTTIVNTAVPSIAASLNVAPLSLKTIVASYILSFAVCIPMSGWLTDHFGTKRVFSIAVILFTLSSILCGVSINASMLVAARILQGVAAAMMMPVGRLTILRTYSKPELLRAMNFVIIPALIAPLLGPTIGGTIVHWFSWHTIFFVNVPIGLLALFFIHKYMPDYYGDKPRPFDLVGMVLFASGIGLLSWLLEVFAEHQIDMISAAILLLVALSLLGAYVIHARRTRFPLLSLTLFRIRTFRISVSGGFITRLGVGGLPFLLPFLYQQGLGMPAWQSGLLMMPVALAAIGMKLVSIKLLNRYGYRSILIANTLMNGIIISLFSLVTLTTPVTLIILLSLGIGFSNSLQFTSINSIAYADIDNANASMASTIASSMQQLAMSFGLACGSLIAAIYLGEVSQSNSLAVTEALHSTFLTLGGITLLSALIFCKLQTDDGNSVSKGDVKNQLG